MIDQTDGFLDVAEAVGNDLELLQSAYYHLDWDKAAELLEALTAGIDLLREWSDEREPS
jgi:hypothetical protein